MNRRSLFFCLIASYCLVMVVVFFQLNAREKSPPVSPLAPYFSYASVTESALGDLPTEAQMGVTELETWDHTASQLLATSLLSYSERLEILADLALVQRDAASLSYQIKGYFAGSLAPVSCDLLLLFFPSSNLTAQGDEYSKRIGQLALEPIKKRLQQKASYYCITPGLLDSIPAPPPEDSAFWEKQLEEVRKEMAQVGRKQMREIRYWAGMLGEGSGDWPTLLNTYMLLHRTPLAKMLLVRSDLAMGLADANLAVWALKDRYGVKRPPIVDPTLVPLIEMPKGPSYPSGHAAAGKMATLIASSYFPENSAEWESLGRTQGWSRVEAGIHYPIDFDAGLLVGQAVADCLLNKEKSLN